MLQRDRNAKLIEQSQEGARFINAWDADFRREVQAKAAAEQWNALGLVFLAAGRLVRRVVCVMVDFWNIPVLGPSDTRRP
jgi:hypothetical protein